MAPVIAAAEALCIEPPEQHLAQLVEPLHGQRHGAVIEPHIGPDADMGVEDCLRQAQVDLKNRIQGAQAFRVGGVYGYLSAAGHAQCCGRQLQLAGRNQPLDIGRMC